MNKTIRYYFEKVAIRYFESLTEDERVELGRKLLAKDEWEHLNELWGAKK